MGWATRLPCGGCGCPVLLPMRAFPTNYHCSRSVDNMQVGRESFWFAKCRRMCYEGEIVPTCILWSNLL